MRKKWISIICAVIIMVCTIITPAYAAGIFLPEESNTKQAESTDLIEAPSGILMEAQTGTVVYQKDADTRRSPASITKIMTLILIFDALDKGSLKMDVVPFLFSVLPRTVVCVPAIDRKSTRLNSSHIL